MSTSTTGDESSDGADASTGTTTGGACDPDAIPDPENFVYVGDIEIGTQLEASFYDNSRQQVTILASGGAGTVLDIDGNVLGKTAAPAEALPQVDGAAYDTAADLALLINQPCVFVEADPVTLEAITVTPLDHGMLQCSGLAIDPQGNLYIASHGTQELVVLTRDTMNVITRVDMSSLTCFDGIAEIPGSSTFIINDSVLDEAMIIGSEGEIVVPSAPVGMAPLTGGPLVGPSDGILTICENGHVWLCDVSSTICAEFAPERGDFEACGCLDPA